MQPFRYLQARSVQDAVRALAAYSGEAALVAGGTALLDLMKLGAQTPELLIDISRLPLDSIDTGADGLRIGALVRNAELAAHPLVRERYPVLVQALLAGASPQLRNMATLGGNLMQRSRCPYFRTPSLPCNKRLPGSGCGAQDGRHRGHAILGGSRQCIAVHPSDLAVALAALDAQVLITGPGGERTLPVAGFHRLPGDAPHRETELRAGELITGVWLPARSFAARSRYYKVRDRAAFDFALVSAAVALALEGDCIRDVRLVLGGVAPRPWRCPEAEQQLRGMAAGRYVFEKAAAVAVEGAAPHRDNAFKVGLARRLLVRALTELSQGASP